MNKLLTKIVGVALGATMAVGVGVGVAVNNDRKNIDSEVRATSDFSEVLVSKSGSTYYQDGYITGVSGNNQATWTGSHFSATQAKNTGNAVSLTYAEIRVYQYHSFMITPDSGYTIDSIVITANSGSYATAVGGSSLTNCTKTVSSSTVTLTPEDGTDTVGFTNSAQSRLNYITVNYSAVSTGAETVTSIVALNDKKTLDIATANDSTTITATVKSNNVDLSSPSVTFTAEPNNVVSLSGTGLSRTVTALKTGKATITASYAGESGVYLPSSGTIVVTVVNSNLESVVFTAGTDVGSSTSVTKSGIAISVSDGDLSRNDNYRVYKTNTITFTSSVGKINEIEIECTASGTAEYGPGNISGTGFSYNDKVGKWEGSSDSVTLTASGSQIRMTSITVRYEPSSDTFTVTYDANGGLGTMTDSNSPYALNATVTTLNNAFTRDGYTFAHWSTATDGTGTDYNEGATFTISANTVLYAIWDQNGGGSVVAARCYHLVENVSDLVAGAKYIITSESTHADGFYALSTNQKSSNRGAASVTANGSIASVTTDDVEIVTLGGSTGAWTFSVTGGYLYASSSSGNQLKTQATNNANGQWAISINGGVASIVAQGSNTRNVMQYNYNNSSPLFACYASASQSDVCLYRLDFEETLLHNVVCDGDGNHVLPQGYTWNTNLKAVFDDLPSTERTPMATAQAAANSGLERYDYIMSKYNPTNSAQSDYLNFIGRTVNPLTAPKIAQSEMASTAATTIVIIISVLSMTTLCGYFLLRKRKEEK